MGTKRKNVSAWVLHDPNRSYVTERGGHGFRPLRILDGDGNQIAYCGDRTDNLPAAVLMVAAPDLLAALQEVRRRLRVPPTKEGEETFQMILAAIAKATGAAQ